MKNIILGVQVLGVFFSIFGMGYLAGAIFIFDVFAEAGVSCDFPFWKAWSVLVVGALVLLVGYGTDFIYDAGCKSAAKEDKD